MRRLAHGRSRGSRADFRGRASWSCIRIGTGAGGGIRKPRGSGFGKSSSRHSILNRPADRPLRRGPLNGAGRMKRNVGVSSRYSEAGAATTSTRSLTQYPSRRWTADASLLAQAPLCRQTYQAKASGNFLVSTDRSATRNIRRPMYIRRVSLHRWEFSRDTST